MYEINERQGHLLTLACPSSVYHFQRTCPYNVNPLEPHFFNSNNGVYSGIHISLFGTKTRRGGSNVYQQCIFLLAKRRNTYIKKF